MNPDDAQLHRSAERPLTVSGIVASFLDRRDFFLDLARLYGSPLFVIEEAAIKSRAHEFLQAFRTRLPDMQVFFPVKANPRPCLLAAAVRAGLGLEVSSGIELALARNGGAREMLFNGPAKTDDELQLALRNSDCVTVILDSSTELDRLAYFAAMSRTIIKAGVRLAVETAGLWRKFGIAMADLGPFLDRAHHRQNCQYIDLRGLHFHTSWNMNPSAYVKTLASLGQTLRQLKPDQLKGIDFVDIGGGFWPPQGDWAPTLTNRTDSESVHNNYAHGPFYSVKPSSPIAEFAEQISNAFHDHIFPYVACHVYTEPGRWICNDAMHLLLSVIDRKSNEIAITDGGTNAIGWDRFEHEYFPVINLSRPEIVERPFLLFGSLCTPQDLWGRSFHGADIQRGDVLLIPMQGAYSMPQHFIKPLPRTVFLSEGSNRAEDGEITP